jgi:hypothetical protein
MGFSELAHRKDLQEPHDQRPKMNMAYGVTNGRDQEKARDERGRSTRRAERCSKSEGAHMGLKRSGRTNNFRGCRDKENLLIVHPQENKWMTVINCFILR